MAVASPKEIENELRDGYLEDERGERQQQQLVVTKEDCNEKNEKDDDDDETETETTDDDNEQESSWEVKTCEYENEEETEKKPRKRKPERSNLCSSRQARTDMLHPLVEAGVTDDPRIANHINDADMSCLRILLRM